MRVDGHELGYRRQIYRQPQRRRFGGGGFLLVHIHFVFDEIKLCMIRQKTTFRIAVTNKFFVFFHTFWDVTLPVLQRKTLTA